MRALRRSRGIPFSLSVTEARRMRLLQMNFSGHAIVPRWYVCTAVISQGTELYNARGAAGNEIPPMRASHAFRSEIAQKSSETNATNLTAFEQLIRSI